MMFKRLADRNETSSKNGNIAHGTGKTLTMKEHKWKEERYAEAEVEIRLGSRILF